MRNVRLNWKMVGHFEFCCACRKGQRAFRKNLWIFRENKLWKVETFSIAILVIIFTCSAIWFKYQLSSTDLFPSSSNIWTLNFCRFHQTPAQITNLVFKPNFWKLPQCSIFFLTFTLEKIIDFYNWHLGAIIVLPWCQGRVVKLSFDPLIITRPWH